MKKWSLVYDLLSDNGGVRLVGVEDLLVGVEPGGEDLVWSEDRIWTCRHISHLCVPIKKSDEGQTKIFVHE